jgi:SAM-dependent methyltransferase
MPTGQDPFSVLDAALDVEGRVVVDVGCGDGDLVRHLARRGATVIGIETGPEPLRRARAASVAGDERYLEGIAEDLPLPAAGADAITFINSLHHVQELDRALQEAARVLRPGGTLYIQEPLARGPYFELLREIDDETEVRRAAYEAIGEAGRHGFDAEREMEFDAPIGHPDFEAFRDRIVMADGDRAAGFDELAAQLRDRFEQTGERVDGRYRFLLPMRVNILRRG